MRETLFQIQDLTKHFISGKNTVRALDGVSFDINKGETLSLVGESGCGKTTCARTLLGVYEPTEGSVLWNGQDTKSLTRAQRTDFRRRNQMIFQDPYASLDPRMTVAEIMEEGRRRHFSETAAERRKLVKQLLETVGLTAEFAARFPHELSGGQRQRVGIARALALEPEFLACDEPIAALDVSIQAQILNLLMRLQRERGLTYLMISHDLTMVRLVSDRVAVLYLGSIVELSDTEELYSNPMHPYTKALFSAIPKVEPDSNWLNARVQLTGEVPDPAHVPAGCKFAPRCPYATEKCRQKVPPLTDRGKGHLAACWQK
ncbi:MAG: ABC transporter ATP-binding protein [Oscillospiraceae bacterium]|nr:ABC transporter ATP-binding protein [Oscillospiraceae bacterium]